MGRTCYTLPQREPTMTDSTDEGEVGEKMVARVAVVVGGGE